MAHDLFGTDLRLVFARDSEGADLATGLQDLETVEGLENLVQALTLRLLVDRGELAGLAHPRYGSRIRDLIGEPLDRANLELLRRYVRQELLRDPRVEEVLQVSVTPHDARRDGVDVLARVRAVTGQEASLEVHVDGT
ncbi:DUF2634 domain-containing protein [Zoogloea sp.]|uniref:DUF2634 domain-containing protein n=1 Tax=Zoogloea sp. TaxID=49181 RepID=UPI0026377926|nr:DUF2634 domain-containing protein [Zoogloea sp.]